MASEAQRSFVNGLVATPPGPPDLGFLLRTLVTGLLVLAAGWWFFSRHAGRFGEEG